MTTELEPEELLDVCKAIEGERGRDFDAPRHGPRPVDVDLLLLGDVELETERLTLPAPRGDLAPVRAGAAAGARPGAGAARWETRSSECLAALGEGERVVRCRAALSAEWRLAVVYDT